MKPAFNGSYTEKKYAKSKNVCIRLNYVTKGFCTNVLIDISSVILKFSDYIALLWFTNSLYKPLYICKGLIVLNRLCKTKTPNSVISSGSFIEDFDFVRSEVVTTRQEWLCEGGSIAVARWRAVGVSKVWDWVGVWCSVVGNFNIVSSSKCWSIGRAAVDGISSPITILSCLIKL